MRKHLVILIMIAAIVSISISGCTGAHDSKDISSDDEVIIINFAFWEPGMELELGDGLKSAAEKYEEIHPNIKINLMPQSQNGYREWLKARMITNDMPDIIYDYSTELNRQYEAGYIIDLEDELNSPNPYYDNIRWRDIFEEERIE